MHARGGGIHGLTYPLSLSWQDTPALSGCSLFLRHHTCSLYMIGATGSVRGKKEFEPNSLAPESEPLLGPHLEDYWSIEDYWARSGGLLG